MKRDYTKQEGEAASPRVETVAEQIERLKPEPGDILLFHHPERFRSRLISWFTRSPFYHVGIYAGNGDVIEARIPEVMRRNLYTERDGYRFVVLRGPNQVKAAMALMWARKQLGARYDLWSLAALVASRLTGRPQICQGLCGDRFICGNFVVRAYAEAGVDLFPGRSANEIAPSDFGVLFRNSRRKRLQFAPASARYVAREPSAERVPRNALIESAGFG